jgi:putative inorganic carbon (hco3(-)) transporter
MAELIWRLRGGVRAPGARGGDAWFALLAGGAAALVVGWGLTVSVQAACAFTLVALVLALYEYKREWGVLALLALWLLAPGIRRLLALITGHVENDPLSVAPFLATVALAGLELLRMHVPTRIRRLLLIAAAGLALGLPVGFVAGPQSAVFAAFAYLAGISAAVLGAGERGTVRDSTLRRALLFGMVPIAGYAILQRVLALPSWDQLWLDATRFGSIGVEEGTTIRVFASLNSPGTLAALLGLSLLCFLTVHRARLVTIAGAALLTVALALTFVRSAWVGLMVAGLAHVIASRGRSAGIVLGSTALIAAATLALAPVNSTAQDVVERVNSIVDFRGDTSSNERRQTFINTAPEAASRPLGTGLGTAGEPSKLSGQSALRATDNGYLALLYQSGPIGFLLVLVALGFILAAAWSGARAQGPGQELRLLLFAMLVYLLVLATSGDVFYGVHGVILWFICGQVLAYDMRRRAGAVP